MAVSSTDQRDLVLPLFAGVDETPLWDTFLQRLLARTQARRISLHLRLGGSAGAPRHQRTIAARGETRTQPLDLEGFNDVGLIPYGTLRPNRVYSLEETILYDDSATAKRQRSLLQDNNVAHARFIRIPTRDEDDLWLVLLHDIMDFNAETSALLSALAPHISLALSMVFERNILRLRCAVAEDGLALLGVGQAAFDAEGQIVAADALSAAELDYVPDRRPALRSAMAQAVAVATSDLAAAKPGTRRVVQVGERDRKDILLRPAPASDANVPERARTIALVRKPVRAVGRAADQVLAATLGLSLREAALANAICSGSSIIEAGAALQLTPETARNYSKRIYAKTGATGQADLVRIILTGLAPFA